MEVLKNNKWVCSSMAERSSDKRDIQVQFLADLPKLKDKIYYLIDLGYSPPFIIKYLGCSKNNVYTHFKRLGIDYGSSRLSEILTEEQKKLILFLWRDLMIYSTVIEDVLKIDKNIIRSFTKQYKKNNLKDNKNSYYKLKLFRKKYKLLGVIYLGGKCKDCGFIGNVEDYDFHHIDPKEKEYQIGSRSISWEKQKKELDKCELLCSICHRRRHTSNNEMVNVGLSLFHKTIYEKRI